MGSPDPGNLLQACCCQAWHPAALHGPGLHCAQLGAFSCTSGATHPYYNQSAMQNCNKCRTTPTQSPWITKHGARHHSHFDDVHASSCWVGTLTEGHEQLQSIQHPLKASQASGGNAPQAGLWQPVSTTVEYSATTMNHNE